MVEPYLRAWNSMISDCHGDFRQDYQAVASILKSCAGLSAVKWGRALHGSIVRIGHASCHAVSKALLNMYSKCGALDESKKLFGEIGSCNDHDPVFWNILLSGFAGSRVYDAETLRLFREMHGANYPKPSSVTVAIVLPVCARLRDVYMGRSVNCYAIKSGLDTHTLVGNALVSMYAKCGLVCQDAYAAFDNIDEKDVVSWNAIIAGFAENKLMEDAFRLFSSMLKGQIKPNYTTLANILPVCASFDDNIAYWFGKEIHGYVLRHNELLADIFVWNALVSFYLRVGRVEEAELLFRRMELRDLVSWNAIIAGYASNGEWSKGLELFHELLTLDMIKPDSVTLLSIIPACAQSRNLQVGKMIHGYVIRHPLLCEETSVGNALVSFYAKCNDIKGTYQTFFMISRRDLISWNSMLDALVEGGHNMWFLELLHWMHCEGTRPDSVTILSVVHFCVNVLKADKIKEAHSYSIRHGLLASKFDVEPTIGNAILDAYAKCGNIGHASKVFQSLSENRNMVTFKAMISGYINCGLLDEAYMTFNWMPSSDLSVWNLMVRLYAENDCSSQALSLFHELQAHGMKPNAMTIMSLLPACVEMASVQLMKQCHGYVIRSCFGDLHLDGALLDVYAKCGSIGYAFKLFQFIPNKDLIIFTAMIRGYAMHGLGKEALGIFFHMIELGVKPDHVVITTVLSACSHAGLVDEGLNIFYSIEKVHGMKLTMEQYSCVVDLLARGGQIDDAFSMVNGMPIEANANIWGALLGACRTHHEVELGCLVADRLFKIEAENIGNYVVLSNLYAADARWDGVMEIRKLMRTRDLRKPAGCSWIEVERRKNVFVAGDTSHPHRINIYRILRTLNDQIKEPFQLNQL
ncbi:hypothetical protein OIU79_022319 [Salix purpurea]|uniref:Chlororespiratory reduction 21 n=1 Tax=Salix purpurea TaxID=77065 RepID=A0A9Q0WH86_SALPP|nr:hypothetical protein OIU79_022319 [Salix purpurea]